MAGGDTLEVRSYHPVFDLERRIYRVDRLRLNPGGIPMRGLAYLAALTLASLALARLPVIGALLTLVPWLGRVVVLPGALAAAMTVTRIDGRPFHLFARSALAHAIAPRSRAALRPCPARGSRWRMPALAVLCDGSSGRLRRLRYRGPGSVLVLREHTGHRRGRRLVIAPAGDGRALPRGRVVTVGRGAVLEVLTAPR